MKTLHRLLDPRFLPHRNMMVKQERCALHNAACHRADTTERLCESGSVVASVMYDVHAITNCRRRAFNPNEVY